MHTDSNQEAFFELVRAGLWEKEARLSEFKNVDYAAILQMAEEQSVVGLVTAGLEHVNDVKVPQEELLQYIGSTLQIEQQNKDMNMFLAKLIEKLRKEDVYTILVKGQGIAQCYEKPLWRASGDIDLLLSDWNYEKTKNVLLPLAVEVESEYKAFKHVGMTMQNGIVVELHGTMHSRLSQRVDKAIDEVQKDVFISGNVRSWANGNTQVFLPSADNDVIFVFTHILHHYFIDGIGLRQICDWCRLLWTYREKLDLRVLETRIRKAGLMSEWRAFAALAVDWLGMSKEAMPLYNQNDEQNAKLKRKAEQIMELVLESGNFGHKQKRAHSEYYILRKVFALWRKLKNLYRNFKVFPVDSMKFFCGFVMSGLDAASRRE